MKLFTEIPLKESPFVAEIGQTKFYFSSQRKLNHFMTKYEVETIEFNKRLNRQYNKAYDLALNDLALLRFYKYVERDDFYIEIDGVGISCLEEIKIESVVKVVERVS